MYCIHCGKLVSDDVRVCPYCGESFDDLPPEPAEERDTGKPESDKQAPASHRKAGLIALVLLAVACVVAIGAVFILLVLPRMQAETSYYGQNDPLLCSMTTHIVPYNDEGKPLSHYRVVVEIDEDNLTLQGFDDTDGFTLDELGVREQPDRVVITDRDTNQDYELPPIELTDSRRAPSYINVMVDDDVEQEDPEEESVEEGEDEDSSESGTEQPEFEVEARQREVTYPLIDNADLTVGPEDQTVTWTYPYFSSHPETDAVEEINQRIEAEMDEAEQEARAWTYASSDARVERYDLTCTYFDGRYAGLRLQVYVNAGGAHGNIMVTGRAIDVNTGEETDVAAVLGVDWETLEREAESAITTYFSAHLDELYSGSVDSETVQQAARDHSRYYLADEGLIFATSEYEFGSYASGWQEIVVRSNDGGAPVGSSVNDRHVITVGAGA